MGISRSSYRYEAVKKDEDALRERIRALAMRHRRYGSPRICAMLKREGLVVNHKRVERIYLQEKLMLRRKSGCKRKVSSPGIKKPVAIRPMQIWSIDFVSDSLASGARFRALTIVDNFTKVCPGILVGASLPGARVATYLDGLAVKYGYPEMLSVDNGPEFRGESMRAWATAHSVELCFSRPGKPTDNCFIESFNDKFRDECLNENLFTSLRDARALITAWVHEYNHLRPHSTLGYCTPNDFVQRQKPGVNSEKLALSLVQQKG